MWIHSNADDPHLVIEVGSFGEFDHFIADDLVEFCIFVAVIFFNDSPHTVVAKPTNVAALCVNDVIEEGEFGVASIGHVQPIRLKFVSQNRSLIVLPATVGSYIDARWNAT